MREKPAFIWDLDGTVLDSYEVIVPSLQKACRSWGVLLDPGEIRREVLTDSVNGFLQRIARDREIPLDALRERYSGIADAAIPEIRPMEHAAEVLRLLAGRGAANFVYTHRGRSAPAILKNTGLYDCFSEIVTGQDGFARKPDPGAIEYLLRKYALAREKAYYVGDRAIDVACAGNAGIKSILFLRGDTAVRPTGRETHVVRDLREIPEIAEVGE